MGRPTASMEGGVAAVVQVTIATETALLFSGEGSEKDLFSDLEEDEDELEENEHSSAQLLSYTLLP